MATATNDDEDSRNQLPQLFVGLKRAYAKSASHMLRAYLVLSALYKCKSQHHTTVWAAVRQLGLAPHFSSPPILTVSERCYVARLTARPR